MPNWVANRLIIEGENAEKIIESITKQGEVNELGETMHIDFNKIVPMPKELEIINGSFTNMCVSLYLAYINPAIDYYGKDKVSESEFAGITKKLKDCNFGVNLLESTIERINEHEENIKKYGIGMDESSKDVKDALAYGKRAVDNVLEYGSMDWYDWSLKNWGCKWNALCSQISGNTIYFETPWSPSLPVIEALAKKYSGNSFTYDYAEESAGYFAGSCIFKGGEAVEVNCYDEYSKESYEMYFDLWGCEDMYEFDEKSGTYKYIENEMER